MTGVFCFFLVPFLWQSPLQIQTITCSVDRSRIYQLHPLHHQSWVLGCQRLAHCRPITEVEGMQNSSGKQACQSNFAVFGRRRKRGRANMKGRGESTGRDPTCPIWHPGSWQTTRFSTSSALNQARLGIRPQMSRTSWLKWLLNGKWVCVHVCGCWL